MAVAGAALSYGKKMLQKSAQRTRLSQKKITDPTEKAQYYCSLGIDPEGFALKYINDYVGYGVFSPKSFRTGDFLLQYRGSLMSKSEAAEIEKIHKKSKEGCFMFFFTHQGKEWCIDATEYHEFLARMVNDSNKLPEINCVMKKVVVNKLPCLCLFATRNIRTGEELRYDYGVRTVHWRKKNEKTSKDEYSFTDDDLFGDSDFDVEKEQISDSEVPDSSSVSDCIPIQELGIPDLSKFLRRDAEPVLSTKTRHTGRKKSIDFEMCSPAEALKNKSVVAETVSSTNSTEISHYEREESIDFEMFSHAEVQKNKSVGAESNSTERNNSDRLESMEIEMCSSAEELKNKLIYLKIEQQEISDETNKKTKEDQASNLSSVLTENEQGEKLDDSLVVETPTKLSNIEVQASNLSSVLTENDDKKEQDDEFDDSLVVEMSKQSNIAKRPCNYCDKLFAGTKLKRHILRKHKHVTEVADIRKLSNAQQRKFFKEQRIEAIYKHNINLMKQGLDKTGKNLLRERFPKYEDNLRMCDGCKRFISNRSYYKHKLTCNADTPEYVKVQLLVNFEEDDSFTDILSRFTDNRAGHLCRTNKIIQQVGYRHFCLRRAEKSKYDEIKKAVMSEMRELARLFLIFQSLCDSKNATIEDMFTRKFLNKLREAINKMAEKDHSEDEKYGLKLNLNSIIKRTIKSLTGFYSVTLQDDKKKELLNFKDAYEFRAAEIFAKSRYKCLANSMGKARRPEKLPVEETLRNLNQYIKENINLILENGITAKNYNWLRSLIVCRLTLYNARRGEEPSRMLVSEWIDAAADTWLPLCKIKEVEDPVEKYLIGQFRLAYLLGKGKSYVPVLIPKDVITAIEALLEKRKEYGIPEKNIFLFATKSISSHCSGWHAVRDIANQAGVKINATENRHRISTLYAAIDMKPQDKEIFFKHMGHDEAINKDNYQCPIGIREVAVMGKFLDNLDKDTNESNLETSEQETIDNSEECMEKDTSESNLETSEEETIDNSEERIEKDTSESNLETNEEETIDNSEERIEKEQKTRNSKSVLETAGNTFLSEKKGISVRWTEQETNIVLQHFSTFFQDGCNYSKNEGNLPKKKEILEFLVEHKLNCIKDMNNQEAYKKIRIKLFNERKRMRQNIARGLKSLTDR